MKRLIPLIAGMALMMVPNVAMASDLDELLERGRDAAYSAEQIITCRTPEGVTDAIVRISQSGGDIHISSQLSSDVEVTAGYGGWTLSQSGSVVSSTDVDANQPISVLRYTLDEGTPAAFLGRRATLYEMTDGDILRAQLIIDNATGAMMRSRTFNEDGQVYCERRFITFDPTPPQIVRTTAAATDHLKEVDIDTGMPEDLAGFARLDLYSDEDGFVLGYYSDGFFSFAVFQTPSIVALADASDFQVEHHSYRRAFTPGMVIYVWETADGAMALIGDLPPDLHADVLSGLPEPIVRGWWGRLWRNLFG